MIRMASRPVAWLLLLVLLYVTVSPIEMRPITGSSPNLERLVAFAAVGFVFVFAYPRHWLLVICLIVGTAFAFELAQLLAPGRHAQMKDAVIKAAGGGLGVSVGLVFNRLFARFLPP